MKIVTLLCGIGAITYFTAGQPGKAAELNANPSKLAGANSSSRLGITEIIWLRTAGPRDVAYREEISRAYLAGGLFYYFKNGILVKIDASLIEAEEIDRLDELKLQKARADADAIAKRIVNERYDRAKELIKRGASAEALKELLWCYDEGMVQTPSFGAVRRSFLLSSIRDLGQSYRPAREALRTRDDAIVQRMLAGDTTAETVLELVALDRALGLRRTGLGVYETSWERGESVYSESNLGRGERGGSFAGAGRTEALQADGRYYYFKNGILVKTDAKRIPAKTINEIDDRKIVREYFAQPPLGTNETDWRNLNGNPAYITTGASAFRWREKYYHFKNGILVRIDSNLSPAPEIIRLDEQKIAREYVAPVAIGMAQEDWQLTTGGGEIVYRDADLQAYRAGEAYYHFRKGVLVAVDSKLIPATEIGKIDEQKILNVNEPALGATEHGVARRWEPFLVYSAADAIRAYHSNGSYYHFRDGVLVKIGATLIHPEEIAPLEAHKIFVDYLAQSPLGMPQTEWRRPLVYNENGVKAYRTADAFYYFKNGILVKIDQALIFPQEISQLDEAKFLAANLRKPPKVVPLPKAPSGPMPESPAVPWYDRF